jgi:hypothetical protein
MTAFYGLYFYVSALLYFLCFTVTRFKVTGWATIGEDETQSTIFGSYELGLYSGRRAPSQAALHRRELERGINAPGEDSVKDLKAL